MALYVEVFGMIDPVDSKIRHYRAKRALRQGELVTTNDVEPLSDRYWRIATIVISVLVLMLIISEMMGA